MRRKPEKRDETEEFSLEDTQEYFTAPKRERPPARPKPEPVSDETAEYEAFPDESAEFEDGDRLVDDAEETTEFEEVEELELNDETEVLEEDGYIEDDGYLEDADDFEDEYYEEPLDGDLNEPDGPAEAKDSGEPALQRLKIAWASLMADAREIELPGASARRAAKARGKVAEDAEVAADGVAIKDHGLDTDEQTEAANDEPKAAVATAGPNFGRLGAVAAILIVSLLIGIAAFLIGKGSGEDVTAAKLEGQAAGKKAGAIEGAAKGYPVGFQKGRDAGFNKAYVRAYKIKYKEAFEQAGQDVPADKDIDVPDP